MPSHLRIEVVLPHGNKCTKLELWSLLGNFQPMIEGIVITHVNTLIYGTTEAAANAIRNFLLSLPAFEDLDITLNQVWHNCL